MEDIDVFYMDPTFIDLQVYSLWLEGLSGKTNKSLKLREAAKYRNCTHSKTYTETRIMSPREWAPPTKPMFSLKPLVGAIPVISCVKQAFLNV